MSHATASTRNEADMIAVGHEACSPDAALALADADREPALQRLFSFIRVPSISVDPAHAADRRRAAEWLAHTPARIVNHT